MTQGQLIVEKEGQERSMTLFELQQMCSISYIPQLDFLKWAYFTEIAKKTAKMHKKGLLDAEQLWLGAYFQKEILSTPLPPVRLRWIDETVGWGVFAERDLKQMEYIGEYAGMVRPRKRSDAKNAYCFEYVMVRGERTRFTIDAQDQGGIVRFINHSAKPNLTAMLATVHDLSHIAVFAARAISKGEQICYDYGQDYWKGRCAPQEF